MNLKILKEPYPFDDSTKMLLLKALAFGLFIFCFLYFFQPFGLGNYHAKSKTLQLLGYGGVTSFLLIFNHFSFRFIFPKWYNKKSWTVGKNILFTLWMFFTIGLGNLLYSVFLNFLPFSFGSILFYQGLTISMGIIPVVISTLLVYQNKNATALKEAAELNSSMHLSESKPVSVIKIPSANKSENVSIDANQLLMVKAVENYIELHHLNNSEVEKNIIRTTLKSVHSTFIDYPFIQKCHRSYLVNLSKVNHFSGNAQGLTLSFEENDELSVPVSRAYVKTIKEQLSK